MMSMNAVYAQNETVVNGDGDETGTGTGTGTGTSAENVTVPEIKLIDISLTLNKETFSPGDKLKISGLAKTEDGGFVNGVATIRIETMYGVEVRNGIFKFETILRDKIKSGEHEVSINIEDEEGNKGKISKKINVKAIPSKLEIYLNNNSFVPGSFLEASIILKDQNSEQIDSKSVLTLYDSRGAEIDKVTLNGEEFKYEFPNEAVPGEWWIYAFSENIKARRFFQVEETPQVDAFLEGNLLKIENIGNIPYKERILITFLGEDNPITEVKEIVLGIGREIELELTAPKGSYLVQLEAEDFQKDFLGVSLTGGVIGAREKRSAISKYFVIGIILGAGLLALIVGMKVKKKTTSKKK